MGIKTFCKNYWTSKLLYVLALAWFDTTAVCGQVAAPRVLIVTAHPDDETAMAGAVYGITHHLHGTVHLCVITNGEAGYKYSTLAEPIYNLQLTNPEIGRKHLPEIRKRELQQACKIIGIDTIFFLMQTDSKYGIDEHDPLDTSWHVAEVNAQLANILLKGHYDMVWCLLPVEQTHGAHKAATLLALRNVANMPAPMPIVLGVSVRAHADSMPEKFVQLKNYAETKIDTLAPLFTFDRTLKFGYKEKLNYHVVVNWEIAEHKSQGTMQLAMGKGDIEQYWYFAANNGEGIAKCKALFEALAKNYYPLLKY